MLIRGLWDLSYLTRDQIPTLQGGFLTTGTPGQSLSYLFKRINGASRNLVVFSFLGFPVAQLVKNLAAKQETCVRPLGWANPLEKGTATHSSILTWRIPWTV